MSGRAAAPPPDAGSASSLRAPSLGKRRRPCWVRFVKAASRDLARDVYLTATKRGLDVAFVLPSSALSSSGSGSGSATWTASSMTPTADGSMTDIYSCLSGFLYQLELSQENAGITAMMTYGLLKAKDLELLPTTWRQLLQAALRFAVLQLTSRHESTRAAEKLQTLVELWHPPWLQDYEAFCQRSTVRRLVTAALAAAKELQRAPSYKESEANFDRGDRGLCEASDEELASI